MALSEGAMEYLLFKRKLVETYGMKPILKTERSNISAEEADKRTLRIIRSW